VARRIAPWALAALLASPGIALAQHSSPEAAWRSLIASALAAQASGDHTRALELAERALAAHETPSLERFIASERRDLGHLAAALAAAERCVAGATADEHIPERAATIAACSDLARDLERRVARVAVHVGAPVPAGLLVRVAGVEVQADSLGAPTVVDVGEVAMSATAPGHAPFQRVVAARAGAVIDVDVTLEPLGVQPLAPRATAPLIAVGRTAAPPSRALQRHVALGAAVGGGVALALGSIALGLGASAASRFNDDVRCAQHAGVVYGGASCVDAAGVADAMRPLAIGALVGAGVLGALSAVLYATAPSRAESRARLRCAPSLAGLTCDATF
jgi:hypothetical protein